MSVPSIAVVSATALFAELRSCLGRRCLVAQPGLVLSLLACLLFATTVKAETFPEAAVAQSNDATEIALNEEELLIVEFELAAGMNTETLFVFQSPDATLLPIDALMGALEFPVEIDIDELLINGWFISEDQRISVDIPKRRYFSRGLEQSWPKGFRYAVDGFDLYIDLQTLERLFGLRFLLDVSQLTLSLESKQALPVLEKLKRQQKQQQLRKPDSSETPQDYVRNEYAWFGKPQFDVSLSHDAEHYAGDVAQVSSAVLQGRMDLLKHSLRSSYINNDGEADLRMTFSRAADGPDRDMFLGIDRYELGDVSSDSDPLLFSSVKGRGVHFERGGNSALERGSAITIEGDAPPMWELELYRNGFLVEFSEAGSDGRFSFEEVPIFAGENNFEVRIYGPQGQYRVARRQISVGGQMVTPGEWEYQVLGIKRNKHLIRSQLNEAEQQSDFLLTQATYGVNEYFSIQAGLSQMTPDNTLDEQTYQYVGVYGSLFGALSQLKVAMNESGQAVFAASKMHAWGTSFNVDFLKFEDFISDRNPDGRLESDINLRTHSALRLGLPSAVHVGLSVNQRQFSDGSRSFSASNNLSSGWAGYQLAHDLDFSRIQSTGSESRLSGALSATRRWLGWRLKGGLSYSLSPVGRIDSLDVGAAYKASQRFNYQGSYTHSFKGEDVGVFDNNLSWNLEAYSLSFNIGFDTHGLQRAGIAFNSALGYDAGREQYFVSNDSMVNNSAVIVHAFLDDNNNGQYDLGESPMSGLRFKGRSHWRLAPTNEQGFATLTGLRHLTMQRVDVDEKSIDDPFVLARRPTTYIYAHSGSNPIIQMPFVNTIEIEGELALVINGEAALSMGVPVLLRDNAGNIVAETRSEYDGVYLFEKLLPGDYELEFDAHYLQRKGFEAPAKTAVSAYSDEGVVYLEPVSIERGSTTAD